MLPVSNSRKIAYFSMEIALDEAMPTYSGGLGILAGDTLRSAADLSVEMVAITLIHRKGYFRQHLDKNGVQTAEPENWNPSQFLAETNVNAKLAVDGREIHIRVWRYDVTGLTGHVIPAYLLDTDVPQNSAVDRTLTDSLYGGDTEYRLWQEAVLGLGGLAALSALGHHNISVFHMNEGHSSLLTLGLLEQRLAGAPRPSDDDIAAVRKKCVFTTHTPVPAGHDKFSLELAAAVLGRQRLDLLQAAQAFHDGQLNMTYLALRFSHYINGVAMRHGEISRDMFPGYPIRAITNGVHAVTWVAPPLVQVYDRHIPEWRGDNLYLRYGIDIPLTEIGDAHARSKRALLDEVASRTGRQLDEKTLTLCFARRAARYKRAELLFSDLDRLRGISQNAGRLQVIYAGKAHPSDLDGQAAIQRVFEAAAALGNDVPVLYLENYDMRLAKLCTSGADVWLNTPQRPDEASGTSGMKAALNGVPSLSILDGWWIEGCIEGVTGWAIGSEALPLDDSRDEIASLYEKLERVVAPLYYQNPDKFLEMRRSCIALNGSFFNTERMVEQYVANAYAPAPESIPAR